MIYENSTKIATNIFFINWRPSPILKHILPKDFRTAPFNPFLKLLWIQKKKIIKLYQCIYSTKKNSLKQNKETILFIRFLMCSFVSLFTQLKSKETTYESESLESLSLTVSSVSSGNSRTSDSNLSSFWICNILWSMFWPFFGGFSFKRRFGESFNVVIVPLRNKKAKCDADQRLEAKYERWTSDTYLSSPTISVSIFLLNAMRVRRTAFLGTTCCTHIGRYLFTLMSNTNTLPSVVSAARTVLEYGAHFTSPTLAPRSNINNGSLQRE